MAGGLKEVRERISSVKSTQQITKAMKMVAAAKLRRAQQAITEMRPYANKLNEMLVNILSNLDESEATTSFGQEREVKNVCIAVVTSNRGLCGAFNTNVIKAAIKAIENKYGNLGSKHISLLCIGKKGYDFFRKKYPELNIINDYVGLFDDLSADNIATASEALMEAFSKGRYDAVEVAYGSFKNAAVQETKCVPFLPVAKLEVEDDKDNTGTRADYVFEPSKKELLEYLVPTILKTTFQSYVLDTHASEHGARMTAMDQATENAEDLLKELKITYNKARQEAITKEISEIVGGAAALGA